MVEMLPDTWNETQDWSLDSDMRQQILKHVQSLNVDLLPRKPQDSREMWRT